MGLLLKRSFCLTHECINIYLDNKQNVVQITTLMTCVFEFCCLLSLTYIHTSSRVLDATDNTWYVCVQNVSQVSALVGFVLSQTFKNLVKFIRKVATSS
jgi:hypothetical protein